MGELKSRREEILKPAEVLPAVPAMEEDPTLADYTDTYCQECARNKRASTLETERIHLRHLAKAIGGMRLSRITKPEVLEYRGRKLAEGWTPRTANLSITVLRNLLWHAVERGVLQEMPFSGVRALKWVPRKRPLFSTGQIEALSEKALEVCPKSGGLLSNFLLFLAFSGARMAEALRVRWEDIDFASGRLMIGMDGLSKNHEARQVDFNPRLAKHIQEMRQGCCKPQGALFKSPAGTEAKSLRGALLKAREAAGMPDFGFHDCRHHFISSAVMAGIDYMTIAKWVGHKDGGVLIGRVYGHLHDEHTRAMASKLDFGG